MLIFTDRIGRMKGGGRIIKIEDGQKKYGGGERREGSEKKDVLSVKR